MCTNKIMVYTDTCIILTCSSAVSGSYPMDSDDIASATTLQWNYIHSTQQCASYVEHTLCLSLFSYAVLLFTGTGSTSQVSASAFLLGLRKMVGTAPGFNRIFLLPKPMDWDSWQSDSKQAASKCRLQRTECLVGFHFSLVLLTCSVHFFKSSGSLGNCSKLTLSLEVLLHPAATHLFTMVHTISCPDNHMHTRLS